MVEEQEEGERAGRCVRPARMLAAGTGLVQGEEAFAEVAVERGVLGEPATRAGRPPEVDDGGSVGRGHASCGRFRSIVSEARSEPVEVWPEHDQAAFAFPASAAQSCAFAQSAKRVGCMGNSARAGSMSTASGETASLVNHA